MKTGHIFAISTLVISAAFFGILSMFNLPESTTEWIISDVVLGAILYVNYLTIVMGTGKNKVHYSSRKVTA